ncbi:MAG: hypothetical protein LBU41_04685 [Clostridiales Family XIII bacterium]|nr:hypothetical protein [Clostridiales Family XIII bacterium]
MIDTFVVTMKKWILLIGGSVLFVAEGVSLLVLGFNANFFCGLLIGAVASATGVVLLTLLAQTAVGNGSKIIVFFSMIFRFVIYAAAIVASYFFFGRTGMLAAAIGLSSIFVGFLATGLIANNANAKAKLREGRKDYEEVQVVLSEEDLKKGYRKFLLTRKDSIEKNYAGRKYVTYRRYRRYRKINRIGNVERDAHGRI